MAVVVDANLLVVLATRDPRRHQVAALFRTWNEAGEALHAPSLMRHELANALAGLLAGGLVTGEQVEATWAAAMSIPITLHDLVDGPGVVSMATRLGRRSAYDAAYVALADQLGAELWTVDGPLARNASAMGDACAIGQLRARRSRIGAPSRY